MNITLYGASPETCGALCGDPSAYDRAVSAILALKVVNIPVKLNFSITPYNRQDAERVYAFAREHEPPLQAASYMFPPVRTCEFGGCRGTVAVHILLGVPVSAVCSRVLLGRMRGYNRRMKDLSGEVMSFYEDSLSNLTSAKAFGITDLFSGMMTDLQVRYREEYLQYNRFSVRTSAFLSLVGMAVSVCCFSWGVYRLWSGAITYGTMTMFLQLAVSLSSAFSSLIARARELYDFVIIDTPPMSAAPDAECVMELADATFLVVQQNVVTANAINSACAALRSARAKLLGCVLNNAYGAETFVLISTDKAVNPTNIMGASKRLCEMIVQVIGKHSRTKYTAVRFGNVPDSNGSVIPLFKKQTAHGGPVAVTHTDTIRYFMTIFEAAPLVLQACVYAEGGEVFVLNMGEPVRIDNLARNMIRLSGLEPDVDIAIRYTGLRPGEKLFEELLMQDEGLDKTPNELIFIGHFNDFDEDRLTEALNELRDASGRNDDNIRALVEKFVRTYHPAETQTQQEAAAGRPA